MYYILNFILAFLCLIPVMLTDMTFSFVNIVLLLSAGIIFGIMHFIINFIYMRKNKKAVLCYPITLIILFILALIINARYNNLPYIHIKHQGYYVLTGIMFVFSLLSYTICNFVHQKKFTIKFNFKSIISKFLVYLVLLFLITWTTELVKIELFTIKYGKQFENLPAITEEVGSCEYFKVIDYSETDAYLYYITSYEPNPIGFIVHLKYYDNVWNYHSDYAVWSTMGSADEAIWPYWWHYFTR